MKPMQEYSELIKYYQKELDDCLKKGDQTNDPPAIMIRRTIEFSIITIRSIELLLEHDKTELLAQILVRPQYELCLRILWASVSEDGWERLQVYYANEDKKWAEEAKNLNLNNEFSAFVNEKLNEADNVLARQNDNGEIYKNAPDMKCILKQIEKYYQSNGFRASNSKMAVFEYNQVYRRLSRYEHAHISDIAVDKPNVFKKNIVICEGLAVRALLHAICIIAASEPKKEIETIEDNIKSILWNYLSKNN